MFWKILKKVGLAVLTTVGLAGVGFVITGSLSLAGILGLVGCIISVTHSVVSEIEAYYERKQNLIQHHANVTRLGELGAQLTEQLQQIQRLRDQLNVARGNNEILQNGNDVLRRQLDEAENRINNILENQGDPQNESNPLLEQLQANGGADFDFDAIPSTTTSARFFTPANSMPSHPTQPTMNAKI